MGAAAAKPEGEKDRLGRNQQKPSLLKGRPKGARTGLETGSSRPQKAFYSSQVHTPWLAETAKPSEAKIGTFTLLPKVRSDEATNQYGVGE